MCKHNAQCMNINYQWKQCLLTTQPATATTFMCPIFWEGERAWKIDCTGASGFSRHSVCPASKDCTRRTITSCRTFFNHPEAQCVISHVTMENMFEWCCCFQPGSKSWLEVELIVGKVFLHHLHRNWRKDKNLMFTGNLRAWKSLKWKKRLTLIFKLFPSNFIQPINNFASCLPPAPGPVPQPAVRGGRTVRDPAVPDRRPSDWEQSTDMWPMSHGCAHRHGRKGKKMKKKQIKNLMKIILI